MIRADSYARLSGPPSSAPESPMSVEKNLQRPGLVLLTLSTFLIALTSIAGAFAGVVALRGQEDYLTGLFAVTSVFCLLTSIAVFVAVFSRSIILAFGASILILLLSFLLLAVAVGESGNDRWRMFLSALLLIGQVLLNFRRIGRLHESRCSALWFRQLRLSELLAIITGIGLALGLLTKLF